MCYRLQIQSRTKAKALSSRHFEKHGKELMLTPSENQADVLLLMPINKHAKASWSMPVECGDEFTIDKILTVLIVLNFIFFFSLHMKNVERHYFLLNTTLVARREWRQHGLVWVCGCG